MSIVVLDFFEVLLLKFINVFQIISVYYASFFFFWQRKAINGGWRNYRAMLVSKKQKIFISIKLKR